MNANELAVELENYLKGEEYDRLVWEIPDLLRQQQAKNESLKKSCLDEIFKRTYADRAAEVMCEYWMESQSEIENLKHYIEGQNRKILDLSFELEYAKRTDDFVKAKDK